MPLNRREACLMIPALLAATRGLAEDHVSSTAILPSKTYNLRDVTPIKSSDHTAWPLFEGKTHNGCALKLHETELQPGAEPHPPHHHVAEEIFLLCKGSVEVMIDGKRSTLGPGGVAYIASNAEHGLRNVGAGPARYFVLLLE